MPRSRRLRRRPSTPNLQQQVQSAFTADPASPPETPTTSPQFSRKISLKPRHQPDFTTLVDDPNIKPVGNGHQFSYRPRLGPEQLSPRSSSSGSSIAVEDEDEDENEDGDDEKDEEESEGSLQNAPINRSRYEIFLQRKTESESSDSESDEADEEEKKGDRFDDNDEKHSSLPSAPRAPSPTSAVWDLLLEELDPMEDVGFDALEVIYPYEVELPRSRSSSWHKDHPGHLDRTMMRDFNNLNCSAEVSSSSSSEDDDDDIPAEFDEEEAAFNRHQAAMRRLRRVSMSSSVGKRTTASSAIRKTSGVLSMSTMLAQAPGD